MSEEQRQSIQTSIEGIIETLRQGIIVVEEFGPESQPQLNNKL
jgi:hypothetical protein